MHFEAASPAAFIDLFADCYGPLLQARTALSADGRWDRLRSELIAMSADSNVADGGGFRVPSDYLVIAAARRAEPSSCRFPGLPFVVSATIPTKEAT
jgi:hypothetical protein